MARGLTVGQLTGNGQLNVTGGITAVPWPEFQAAVARASEITVPVQINGKLRARVTVSADVSDDELRAAALEDTQVIRYLEGKTVRQVVVAGGAGRLVSVVAS